MNNSERLDFQLVLNAASSHQCATYYDLGQTVRRLYIIREHEILTTHMEKEKFTMLMEQVFQRCCGFCILGDMQNPTGHSTELPALMGPALNKRLGWKSSRDPISHFLGLEYRY